MRGVITVVYATTCTKDLMVTERERIKNATNLTKEMIKSTSALMKEGVEVLDIEKVLYYFEMIFYVLNNDLGGNK